MSVVEVVEPGFLSSIQDRGRFGYQHLGFSVGGAVDVRSLVLANHLVGNPLDAACLEATVRGPRLRFTEDCLVAVVGPEPTVLVNRAPVEANRNLLVRAGDELEVPSMGGARTYLAFGGGVEAPLFLGSRSTDLVAGVGGLEGRCLRPGDRFPTGSGRTEPWPGLRLRPSSRPVATHRVHLLCSPGPQWSAFDRSASATLESDLYLVSPDCDRMGVRLRGRSVAYAGPPVLSEGQPAGSIQIPSGGEPIVLLAGRQTIGGYPKIGVVGCRGLAEMGQALPGDVVTFEFTSLEQLALDTRSWWSKLADPVRAVERA